MRNTVDHEANDVEIYLAGQHVSAGIYREIGSRREVCLNAEDVLPASLDGRVAYYERITATWASHVENRITNHIALRAN